MRTFIEYDDEINYLSSHHELVKEKKRYHLRWIENFRLERKKLDQNKIEYVLWDLEELKEKDPMIYLKVQMTRLQDMIIYGPNLVSQNTFDKIIKDTQSILNRDFGGYQCQIIF